jgi:hypothetical protein
MPRSSPTTWGRLKLIAKCNKPANKTYKTILAKFAFALRASLTTKYAAKSMVVTARIAPRRQNKYLAATLRTKSQSCHHSCDTQAHRLEFNRTTLPQISTAGNATAAKICQKRGEPQMGLSPRDSRSHSPKFLSCNVISRHAFRNSGNSEATGTGCAPTMLL